MKHLLRTGLFLFVALFVGGCANTSLDTQNASRTAPAQSSFGFVDIAKFDRDLSTALTGGVPEITVVMYDKVSPNQTPDRLQKWLNGVERNGGQVNVSPPPNELMPRNALAIASMLGGLWNAIKATTDMRDAKMVQSVKGYDATISLARNPAGQVVIDKVIFVKPAPSKP